MNRPSNSTYALMPSIPNATTQIDALRERGVRVPLVTRTVAQVAEWRGCRVDVIYEPDPFSGRQTRIEIRGVVSTALGLVLSAAAYDRFEQAGGTLLYLWYWPEN